MKFLVQITPRRQQLPTPALIDASKAWLNGKIADKTMDFCYSFASGGGISIVNADSSDGLQKVLMSYPAYFFADWKIDVLCDVNAALDGVKAMVQRVSAAG